MRGTASKSSVAGGLLRHQASEKEKLRMRKPVDFYLPA
ncbi:hypothetical protein BLGI_3989 [Brevibacillus laterosporus GI-9]|nr:hypothetical protein BLGI_3989 [Brevibacillus laterosporus GI-9]